MESAEREPKTEEERDGTENATDERRTRPTNEERDEADDSDVQTESEGVTGL